MRVRYATQYRGDPQALGQVLVATPTGQQLPLAQVADIEQARGPAMISSENGLLLATVLMNVQGRDLGGFVNEAKSAVATRVQLPPGYFMPPQWADKPAPVRVIFIPTLYPQEPPSTTGDTHTFPC